MERAEVVICLPQLGQDQARIGVVLAGKRSPLRVRWEDDGSEQDVVLDNRNRLAARNTLRYEWLLNPAVVGEQIRADPAGAIIRSIEDGLVRDSRGHQDLLQTYGVDLVTANAAWKNASKRIAKRADIKMDRQKRYIWAPPVGFIDDPSPSPSSASSSASSPSPSQSPEPVQTASPAAVLGGDQPAGDRPAGAERPASLVPTLALGSDSALLHATAERLETAAVDAEARTAAVRLLRRLVAAEALSAASVTALGRVIRAVGADAEPADLDAATRMLAGLLSLARPAEAAVVPLDVVADAVSPLPLRPGGGRAAVLVVAARLWPDRVADATWWRGATLTDVVECAEAGLGVVTTLEAVGERVIRPLVHAALADATSRRALSRLLGLPAEFARQLPADAVAEAFRRIGREDATVGGWVAALSETVALTSP